MSLPQKPLKAYIFVDFIPAVLRENKVWMVEYYVKDKATDKLRRKQHRVRPMSNKAQRRKLARSMILNINSKLEKGWNPFVDENEKFGFTKFNDVADLYLERLKLDIKKGNKRSDTLRAYKSYLENIKSFNKQNKKEDMFIIKFDSDYVNKFLDHIYYYRKNSARTRNNYFRFIQTFSRFLIDKKYIAIDPTARISAIQNQKKKRQIIPDNILNTIFDYLEEHNYNYYFLCLIAYYCLIRRTEITRLFVRDVSLVNGIIFIESTQSKNKKSLPITIPNAILPKMARFLNKANNNDYLFGEGFKPSEKPLNPKKISDQWVKLRKTLKLPTIYQWYSLKDTGITNLLKSGVPPIEVRDQARHSSITQTEEYTPKEILKAVESIKTANIIHSKHKNI